MDESKISYLEKLKLLNLHKHEIKKKRIFFDENKDMFGFDIMTQLIKVKNTSEVKGYPFMIKDKKYKFGLKVIPVENKYEKFEHPSCLEYIILQYLTENIVNKQISPHFAHFLGHFKVSNKVRALKHLNLKRLEVEDLIRKHSNVIISEYVEGKSLDNWLHDTYENDEKISDIQWKIIAFQLIYSIHVMLAYFKLNHNDFHYGNILIDTKVKADGYFVYKINNKTYYIPNTGIMPKIFDFEYAMIYSNKIVDAYPNKFIVGHCEYNRYTHTSVLNGNPSDYDDEDNVPYNYSEFYDVHYFLTSLLDLYISSDLFNWIIKMYPEEVIPSDDTTSSSYYSSKTSNSDTSSQSYTSSDSYTSSSRSSSDSDNSDHSDEKIISDFNDMNIKSDNSTSDSTEYVLKGRLVNGAETKFKLPTPLQLLEHEFFNEFLTKPDDFDEKKAIIFTCNK
jgi:hypothetical protein